MAQKYWLPKHIELEMKPPGIWSRKKLYSNATLKGVQLFNGRILTVKTHDSEKAYFAKLILVTDDLKILAKK